MVESGNKARPTTLLEPTKNSLRNGRKPSGEPASRTPTLPARVLRSWRGNIFCGIVPEPCQSSATTYLSQVGNGGVPGGGVGMLCRVCSLGATRRGHLLARLTYED